MRIAVPCLALALSATQAPAQDTVERFYGYAYDLAKATYLYTEVHEQSLSGERWLGGKILYYTPDGREFARKRLDFSRDPYVPVFHFENTITGYREGIRVDERGWSMYHQDRGAKERSQRFDRRGDMAADSGFHGYIRANLAQALKGEVLRFRFVAAGRLDTFGFKVENVGDTRFEGRPAVKLRAGLDSLLSLLADPLELTYDTGNRQLLEYRGISNIHDPRTGEPYEVRIAYYSTPPADVPKLPPLE